MYNPILQQLHRKNSPTIDRQKIKNAQLEDVLDGKLSKLAGNGQANLEGATFVTIHEANCTLNEEIFKNPRETANNMGARCTQALKKTTKMVAIKQKISRIQKQKEQSNCNNCTRFLLVRNI